MQMDDKPKTWKVLKERYKEELNRKKTRALKYQEYYKHACDKERIVPLHCVVKQLEYSNMDLKGKMLGPKDAKVLAPVLVTQLSSAVVVITVVTVLTTTVDKIELKKKADYICAINLASNCLGDEGVSWIASPLPHTMSITRLNFSENNVGIAGLKAIIAGISENILVTTLCISGNCLGDEGAILLSELLETRTGLLELRISHANIEEKGAIAIGKGLCENDTLETLDLSWNHIRGKGAIGLANSLKTNKCLRRLDVSWNGFAKEGAKALGEALAENTRLEELDLTNNRLDRNAMATLMVGLKTNCSLQTLKLSKNSFNNEVAKVLLTLVEANEQSGLILIEFSDVPVSEDFMEILQRLIASRNIHVIHGKLVRKCPEKTYEPPPPPPRDPIEQMFEFKYEHGYRTLDLLNRMDRDNDGVISKDELKLGMLEMDVHVNDAQIMDIIAKLDTDDDGNIDYTWNRLRETIPTVYHITSELVQGEKEYGSRQKRHMNMQTISKIRSLAQAMLKMKIAAKLEELKTRLPAANCDGCGDVIKTEAVKHKAKHK